MYKLRPYQQEVVSVMRATEVGDPSLIVLPTAAGKTICFAKLVSEIEGRVLIIVPSGELREQAVTKIKNLDPTISVGSVQGTKFRTFDSRITIGTWQSLSHKKSNRIQKILEQGSVTHVIIDEVHLSVDKIQEIISQLGDNVKIIGVTATPFNPKLLRIFNGIRYSKSILEMITAGYLCEPLCYRVQSDTDLNSVSISAGDFNENELQKAVNNERRNKLIVKSYLEYASERRSTLVFASGIQHISDLVTEFTKAGINAKGLDSNHTSEQRKKLLTEFARGKLPVLINCGILTVGFDMPELDCIILARPTKSKTLFTQILGRGLRTHAHKENCLVIDIADVFRKNDIMNVNSIFDLSIKQGETPTEARKRTEEENRLAEEKKAAEELAKKLLEQQRQERLEQLRQEQEELRLTAERINLFSTSITKAIEDSEHDFFKIDSTTYCLSYSAVNHYAIEYVNNTYTLYDVLTPQDKTLREVKIIKQDESIDYIMKYLDGELIFNAGSYKEKNVYWKREPASQKQRQYAPNALTKWDAHLHFTSYNVAKLIKDFKNTAQLPKAQ